MWQVDSTCVLRKIFISGFNQHTGLILFPRLSVTYIKHGYVKYESNMTRTFLSYCEDKKMNV